MELVLAVLMGLGIFLVVPVIIGLSIIGLYLLNRRRVLKAERVKLLSEVLEDTEYVTTNANNDEPSEKVIVEKKKEYAEVK